MKVADINSIIGSRFGFPRNCIEKTTMYICVKNSEKNALNINQNVSVMIILPPARGAHF